MNLTQNIKKVRLDLIFFIIGFLLFPLIIILAIYSIFAVKEDMGNTTQPPAETPISSPVSNPIDQSVDTEPALPMTSSTSTVRTGHSDEGLKKSIANQSQIEKTGEWNATQYSKGDIIRNTYIVQSGDTLWQIAEGYYGNGQDWTKILDANKDNIGFLPDGEQALIVPGQILNLP